MDFADTADHSENKKWQKGGEILRFIYIAEK